MNSSTGLQIAQRLAEAALCDAPQASPAAPGWLYAILIAPAIPVALMAAFAVLLARELARDRLPPAT